MYLKKIWKIFPGGGVIALGPKGMRRKEERAYSREGETQLKAEQGQATWVFSGDADRFDCSDAGRVS